MPLLVTITVTDRYGGTVTVEQEREECSPSYLKAAVEATWASAARAAGYPEPKL